MPNREEQGAWLPPSVEQATLDFGAVSSSPMVGIEVTLKKNKILGHLGGSVG